MRNLKKFLALVLAMMMTLSLMVTVNAATTATSDFTDSDSITKEFRDGVAVLEGPKVFTGYTNGDKFDFRPKNNITRAEVATIVYRLATGDVAGDQAHLYADYQKFDDVKSDHWAAGYINYCANAEWIAGYGNGKFGPNDQVTGYQAAAMILRAVGYGKNNEFVGPTWQVQVANVTRSEQLLVNVDNTTYANTLNQPATRELVAEILFQAANIPTVTWTMLGGYSKTSNPLNIGGTNPSLGWTNYGLDWEYGTVVDNQETKLNETWTTFNIRDYENGVYKYDAGGVRLDWDTELKDFGRAYKVWYDHTSAGAKPVYAAYDQSTAYQVVFDNSTLDTDNTPPTLNASTAVGQDDLGNIAQSVGFKLNAAKTAYVSNGYADFHTYKGAVSQGTPYESPQHMYVLLSNSSNKTLDVVISLNVEATKITAINSNVTDKTISTAWYSEALNRGLNGYAGIEGTDFKSTHQTGGVDDVVVSDTSGTTADPATMTILQSKLTTNSSTTFQDYVIGNAIMADSNSAIAGGTANIIAYNTKAAMEKKTGTVVSYHVNPSWNNADPDYVMLSDGTKIEKSVLYLTAASKTSTSGTIIPQVGNGVNANEVYNYSEYEFILDGDGKYIGARPIAKTDFVYGTYVDYTQELSTSTFKYYLTGVDKDGKVVTKEISKHNGDTINTVKLEDAFTPADLNKISPVPYRDTTAGAVNGIGEGLYHPYTVNDGNARFTGFMTGTSNSGILADEFTDKTVIDRESKTLGAEALGDWYNNGTPGTDSNLYYTDNTKFVLVEGFGTDSLKTQVYNGISELLGNNRQVEIDLTFATGHTGGSTTDHFRDNTRYARMTYMEKEKFIYNQTVGVTAEQATLVILPKAAVSFVGGGNLYYVGNQTPGLRNGTGTSATQFTMYDAQGNESVKWIAGDYRTATDDAGIVYSQSDRFYELVETKDKAQDGQPVYELEGHAAVNATYAAAGASNEYYATNGIIDRYPAGTFAANAGLYTALTYSTQNASIMGDGTNAKMYNVANAKVVNLAATGAANAGTRYPGISDLTTLNNSSYNLNNSVKVACVLDKDNPLIVTTIFVCYNQSGSAI